MLDVLKSIESPGRISRRLALIAALSITPACQNGGENPMDGTTEASSSGSTEPSTPDCGKQWLNPETNECCDIGSDGCRCTEGGRVCDPEGLICDTSNICIYAPDQEGAYCKTDDQCSWPLKCSEGQCRCIDGSQGCKPGGEHRDICDDELQIIKGTCDCLKAEGCLCDQGKCDLGEGTVLVCLDDRCIVPPKLSHEQ